jgi:hypothetical protein
MVTFDWPKWQHLHNLEHYCPILCGKQFMEGVEKQGRKNSTLR